MLTQALGHLEDGLDQMQDHTAAEERENLQGMQLIGQEVVRLETFSAEVDQFATPGSRKRALPPLPSYGVEAAHVPEARPKSFPVALTPARPLFTPDQVKKMEDLERSAPLLRARRDHSGQEGARRMLRDLSAGEDPRPQERPQEDERIPNGHDGRPQPQHYNLHTNDPLTDHEEPEKRWD